jgi:hypothetical protein
MRRYCFPRWRHSTDKDEMDVQQAITLLTDEAERQGANANDTSGVVRALVLHHGLGFNPWFCVCCELGDRAARREGFKHQADKAAHSPGFLAALEKHNTDSARFA